MQTRITFALMLLTIIVAPASYSQTDEHSHQHRGATPTNSPLTAPGNDAFAAIQEVVEKMLADPGTDWSRVNLEALRQHLVDMNNFTLNVEVTTQKSIEGGVEFAVKPTVPSAIVSLDRLFSAHPAILKQETGWDMSVVRGNDNSYTARVTGTKPEDAVKIRGLGYIGIVALGKHHQAHHWQMATGGDPHQH